MKRLVTATGRFVRLLGIVLLLLTAGGSGWLLYRQPAAANSNQGHETGSAKSSVGKLSRITKDTLLVPPEVAKQMGVQFGLVKAVTQPSVLPAYQGTLAQDTDRQVRIHSRFAGEVVSLGTVTNDDLRSPGDGAARSPRSIEYLDKVKKGDLLAVVWSKDLGEKKSELVDALSKLKADEETLKQLQSLVDDGASSSRSLREAQRNVDGDRILVDRAERTLLSWRLTEAEIAAINDEANQIGKTTQKDKAKRLHDWARVEVRAPQDGVILDKTVSVGDIVDTNQDLFKIGDLSSLRVWAHVYEEDLPLLNSLPKPISWSVQLSGGKTYPGTLQKIGAVIDPNQHTALVMGRVNNPDGELRIGQSTTVSIDVPPQPGELEVPTQAVIEDGTGSIVFLQSNRDDKQLIKRFVKVIRRTQNTITVKSEPDSIVSGQRVVTSGALLLKEAMDDLPVSAPSVVDSDGK
jgi:cobalt-zinc-cadmium efflux system membrane fusion protein